MQRRQLLIQQNGESHTVPLEDIAVIVIENRETLITAPLLSALAEYGATLLTCDEQFLPCGQWLPYAQYHRQLKILKLQLNISEPLKKATLATYRPSKNPESSICRRRNRQ